MRAIPPSASEFLKEHEACVLRVYDDAHPKRVLTPGYVPDGTLTGGYGHTDASLKPGQIINRATANAWLAADLATARGRLYRKVDAAIIEELTPSQYAALLSFVFNLGVDGKMANATIWKRLNAREFDQIPGELIKFVNAQGKKNTGLVNRRTAEIRLWSTGEPGSDDVVLTSATTRAIPTPATVTDTVPPHKSATIWTAISAPFLTLGAAIIGWLNQLPDWLKQAIAIVNPFSDKSTIVQHMVAGLATTAAIIGVVNAILQARKKNEERK